MHSLATEPAFKTLLIFLLSFTLAGHAMATASKETEHIISTANKSKAQTNTDYLLVKALDKTKLLQRKYGKFFTYGAALFADGSVKFVWYEKPDGGVTQSNNAIPFIRRVLQKQAESGRIIASAVVYKLHKNNDRRAQLNVELEYYQGLAEVFSAEFTVKDNNQLDWGRSIRKPYDARIFNVKDTVNADGQVKW